jgi:ubiquinone/menaquinone biosynthesis C-methylase UbiE
MTEEKEVETVAQQVSKTVKNPSWYDKMHLRMISFVHGTLYGLFVNPYRWLTAAGLAPGQVVLEVGCGPGFFTIPAAETIGREGRLYSLDINPAAVQRVRRKVAERGLSNVGVMLANANATKIPDASLDVAFLFGVLRSIRDLDPVLQEMHRLLKASGVLAVQRSSWSESRLLNRITKDGLFHFLGTEAGIYRFGKGTVES